MSTHRIEKRIDGQPTEYWDARGDTWDMDVEMATVYSERERAAYANDVDFLPTGGVWVRLDDDKGGIKDDLPLTAPPAHTNYIWAAPAFTVQHLAIVRRAVAEVIDEGDPATPRNEQGQPVWSTDWQLYAQGKAESFVEAVAAKVVGMVTGTSDDGKEGE